MPSPLSTVSALGAIAFAITGGPLALVALLVALALVIEGLAFYEAGR